MNAVAVVQAAKLGASALVYVCVLVELLTWTQGPRWRRVRIASLCVMAFSGGFLGMALL